MPSCAICRQLFQFVVLSICLQVWSFWGGCILFCLFSPHNKNGWRGFYRAKWALLDAADVGKSCEMEAKLIAFKLNVDTSGWFKRKRDSKTLTLMVSFQGDLDRLGSKGYSNTRRQKPLEDPADGMRAIIGNLLKLRNVSLNLVPFTWICA